MKIPNLIITTISVITLAFLTGCNSPSKKVEKAEAEVKEANKDLEQANQDYLAEINSYKLEVANKIAANEKSIIEFNATIASKKKEAKEEYKTKIKHLEEKNSDLKKKMADYKVDGKEKWDNFKTQFSRDMDELGKSFVEFINTNKN